MGHKVKQSLMSSRIDFFYHAFRNVLLVSVPLLVVSSVVLSHLSFHSSATGFGTDQIQFSLSTSCTMSSVVDEAHTKAISNGTYHSDVGKTTITTLCNDGNGYSVYANGYSNNEDGNTKLINAEHPEYSIDTGLATSGLISTWAMKLNNIPDDPSPTPPTIESDYNNVYGIVPPYWTKVAGRASGTTDMAQGSSFTTTYAVYASSSQYAGTYSGQVKYLLTHPSYEKPPYYMQEVDKWKNTIALEESVQAIDMRDGKKYWVTKLKDGNIWMTQNLDFDIDTTRTYTHNDTDLGWDPNSFDSNATWKPDTTNGRYNLPVNGTSVSGWSTQVNYPYSADPGDVYYYTSNSEANDIKYNSLSECIAANHTEGDCKHYHAGNYYNWTAAIASNDSSSLTTQYTNAPNSICPAGWRLPIATNANQSVYEFGDLLYEQDITTQRAEEQVGYTASGFENIRKTPLWFVQGGSIDLRQIGNILAYGYYYSSTIAHEGAYFLKFGKDTIQVAHNVVLPYGKSNGMSVRCLAR